MYQVFSLFTVLQVTGSWARAWEQGYWEWSNGDINTSEGMAKVKRSKSGRLHLDSCIESFGCIKLKCELYYIVLFTPAYGYILKLAHKGTWPAVPSNTCMKGNYFTRDELTYKVQYSNIGSNSKFPLPKRPHSLHQVAIHIEECISVHLSECIKSVHHILPASNITSPQ